ncbi:TrlF family AAA-like ATPase [Sphingobacterium sp. Lzh-3]|uniref:TrlF family AAA-like ATPase n=1 Tax=Sphingobacterium sp. Lzh-3 TaxID=3382150 RepID=UPI00398C9074
MISKGSEWNIWDLHVHTPASIFHRYGNDDDVWEKYLLDLESLPNEFKVIGVNDYFFIDGYERLIKEQKENGRLRNLLLFPVLEFRIEKFAGIEFKNVKRINFHVIFSPELSIETIKSQFLNTLEQSYTLESDGRTWTRAITKESVEELGRKIKEGIPADQLIHYGSDLSEGFNNLNLKETQIFESLKKDCFDNKYLIAIGKTEWDDLKWTDASIAQKKSIINDANIVFTASENVEKFIAAKQKLKSQNVNDFLFDCSDAHSFSYDSKEKDRIGNCLNWLKSDISFDGLRQVVIENESRLFVGEKPEIHSKINANRTKYIESIKINQVSGYDPTNHGIWFSNVTIPINPELVAIIGNKGNGKSALADIISLCGNYDGEHDDFSFLNKKRFGDKNSQISKNFEATVNWLSGNSDTKNLSERVDHSFNPKIKYLPQGYFERITNESLDDFNKEIENVVFTHLSDEEKLGKTNFKELIDYKNSVSKEEILKIKSKLNLLNESIFKKQKKLNPIFIKNIEELIKQKEAELDALIEPIEIKNPNDNSSNTEQNEKVNETLTKLNADIIKQEKTIKETEEFKKNIHLEINELKSIKQRIENKIKDIEDFKSSLRSDLLRYPEIESDKLIGIYSNLESLTSLISEKSSKYHEFQELLGELPSEKVNFKSYKLLLNELLSERAQIQKTLGEADKTYQKYLLDKKEWENNKSKIIGNIATPDSLEYYKRELNYIKTELANDIENEKNDRLKITEKIFELKENVLNTYKIVKQKIDSIIHENADLLSAYPIKIEAAFSLTQNFQKRFLDFISLNKSGTYYGKENSEIQLKRLLDNIDLDIFDGVSDLLDVLVHSLFKDLKSENKFTYIEDQVDDVVALYDYLFSLDFLDYNYELRQGSKNLNQLSPGEKGALLLIFYLLLDNNDIPLIIDQPEDNLDNHSVANILVPFIKKAKSKRQIILVTHNPNLAVVADAEQIIYTELDKENNYKFSFKSGAIENPVINDCIVKVLEGAMPAFNKRKMKYYGDN